MLDLRAYVDGLDDIEREFMRAQAELDAGLGQVVTDAAREGTRVARERVRVRTGRLARTIGFFVRLARNGVEAVIYAGGREAPYAQIVEGGSRPHTIRARVRQALRWVDDGGDEHFAKEVQHPGTRPSPFMGPAFLKAQAVLRARAEALCMRVVARFI